MKKMTNKKSGIRFMHVGSIAENFVEIGGKKWLSDIMG